MKALPWFKLMALAQIGMLAHQHYKRLDARERARLRQLVSHPRGLTKQDRSELKQLVTKMEPGAFAGGAARHFSPLGRKR